MPRHPTPAPPPPALARVTHRTVLQIYEDLEAKIAAGTDRPEDRVLARQRVGGLIDDGTASYAFVRAALAGRVAELRGVKAGRLVTEAEAWARASLERDPNYRDQMAIQLLGSLYVMAPGRLLAHGDSEEGLSMLEGLVARWPNKPNYALRLAQAYLYLGDTDQALGPLCAARADRAALRQDEQALLEGLIQEAGGVEALDCDAG